MAKKTKDVVRKELVAYCNENWDLERYEVEKAVDLMDKMRCPLEMANPRVSDYLSDMVDDFITDNDLDPDWYAETYDNDFEELFWDLNIFGE